VAQLQILILGCGYTGRRVAERFLSRGDAVTVTTRDPASLESLERLGARVVRFEVGAPDLLPVSRGTLALHSIPVAERTRELLESFAEPPARMVYLSTTSVYGPVRDVDETTPVHPVTERERMRVFAEGLVLNGPWSSLVLRPAAIYGPGRGVHVSMAAGRFQLAGSGANYVSRIHVEDLASHVEAGLTAEIGGAWPVADEMPCTSREIAEFCARLLSVPMPAQATTGSLDETRRADRRVDGRAIRRALGVALRYPNYREGIAGSL
jgi:nucleoside-diphosphate-sugar epimerase